MKPLLIALLFLLPVPALAFNPDYLISDWELEDPFALDFNQIQHYLNRGYLGDYKTTDWEGDVAYATDIVWTAAQTYSLNPKFILVLLQKEQSLVEDDDPTQNQLDWATGYAVCDSCSKDDPAIQRWKGFGKQVNSASAQFREGYLADIENVGSTQGKYGPDIEVEIDGTTVTPSNAATAALYAYTPHLHGNENFVKIWDRWFSQQYPSGSLLQGDGESGVYYIEFGYKRAIHSWSALQSRFDADLIITVNPNILENYPDGAPIDFPNYSLLQDEDGTIYLLVDDTLRPVDSLDTFHSFGFVEDELTDIDNDDLVYFEIGETITEASKSPEGEILQLSTNGALFFIQDGQRHILLDEALIDMRFSGTSVREVLPMEVEQYTEGDAVIIPEGHLVKSIEDPTVYVISETERLPIGSESAFTTYGWSWDDIETVNASLLKQHRIGDAIEVSE
ncbi:hypothetical protein HON52_04205 [Candidatus Uhrbacteria bacterium]|jgi:hypothetical protein|nr:hypothetical protein [Candidatus Uhrbacteria bacterium]